MSRYHVSRDLGEGPRVIAKFALKPDALKYAKSVKVRKGVTSVGVRDARENVPVALG